MPNTNSDIDYSNWLNADDEQEAADEQEESEAVDTSDRLFCDACQCSYTTNCLCGMADKF